MKRLVVCCDGTWNKLDAEHPTNVVKMAQAVRPVDNAGVQQVVFYDEGVGTEGVLNRYIGGGLGKGLTKNVQDAYRFLTHNYQEGDHIFLFGFSRGAYTVRSLAGLMRCSGLLKRHHSGRATQAHELYRDKNRDPDHPDAADFRRRFSREAMVHVLGCWDTVGALGIPRRLAIFSRDRFYRFHDTALSHLVRNAFHAISIDERRQAFEPTLFDLDKVQPNQRVEQVYFPGDHGAVGGGQRARGLSDSALLWMADRAKQYGLALNPRYIGGLAPDPTTAFDNRVKWFYRAAGVAPRKVTDDPTQLHDSVGERWRQLPGYRPANLAKHAAALSVEQEPPMSGAA